MHSKQFFGQFFGHSARRVFPAFLLLSACGARPDLAQVSERYPVHTSHVTAADAQAYIQHFDEILATGSGTITMAAFLSLMPMQDGQRQIISDAFPTPYAVTCASGLCAADIQGDSSQAVMDVTIAGVSQPLLLLDGEVGAKMVRRADGIEFCNVTGIWAKKLFVSKPLTGMLLKMVNGEPNLTVNVNDDEENYTCD